MTELFDPVLLARVQFGFTVAFHILFPAFTIGLASWLAVVEWRWLRTGNPVYEQLYKMWIKIFAVTFGMGVVSGVVMSYQFGTNWSVFSDKVGNVIGPLLGYEVLTAFFLEASFLGVMLFGWGRVSKRMHFTSTCIVAFGTLVSAFWILSANSWMQTPQGFRIGANGLLYPTDWMEVIFNPSFPIRYAHMVTGAYLTTAFAVGGVAALYLFRRKHIEHAQKMFGMAMLMAVFVAPIQLLWGDLHGLNTLEHQPQKVAAMEGLWETERGAGLRLFAIPDEKKETNHYEVVIPKLSSLILTHSWDGEVKGLKAFPKDERPPVSIVFWSFRIMVGLGMAMIATGIFATILWAMGRLYTTRWFQTWCIALTPAGFIAIICGWITTEVGRQPYVAYGVLKTKDMISPILGEYVALSLLAFIIVYTIVFGAGAYYIVKLVKKGPTAQIDESEQYYAHGAEHMIADAIDHKKNGA